MGERGGGKMNTIYFVIFYIQSGTGDKMYFKNEEKESIQFTPEKEMALKFTAGDGVDKIFELAKEFGSILDSINIEKF